MPDGLVRPSLHRLNAGEVVMGGGVVWVRLQGFSEQGDAFVGSSQIDEHVSQIVVGLRLAGTKAAGLLQRGEGSSNRPLPARYWPRLP